MKARFELQVTREEFKALERFNNQLESLAKAKLSDKLVNKMTKEYLVESIEVKHKNMFTSLLYKLDIVDKIELIVELELSIEGFNQLLQSTYLLADVAIDIISTFESNINKINKANELAEQLFR